MTVTPRNDILPTGARSAALFRDFIQRYLDAAPPLEWDRALRLLPASEHGLERQVQYLSLVNCHQWDLEDACRLHYDQQAVVGRLKYLIDESNRRRVAAMDAIDEDVVRRLSEHAAGAGRGRIALATPGVLLDRLSILLLRRYHVGRRAGGEATREMLDEQIADLCDGIDHLVEELLDGRSRIKFYPTVKLYGPPPTPEPA